MAKFTEKPGQFAESRSILDYRPSIDYVEPEQIDGELPEPDVNKTLPVEPSEDSLDATQARVNDLIQGYGDLVVLADQIQDVIDRRCSTFEVHLDEQQDAAILDALQRHSDDPDKKTIAYKDYRECIDRQHQYGLLNTPGITEDDITAAFDNQYQTDFHLINKLPGLARPELDSKAQIVKPLDMKKFKKQLLYQLLYELLNIALSGPLGKVVKKALKKLFKWLRKKLKKTKNAKLSTDLADAIAKDTDPDDNERVDEDGSIIDDTPFDDVDDQRNLTKFQDCNMLIGAFERGSHFANTEQAVYAPMTKQVQGEKLFAQVVQKTLHSYKPLIDETNSTAIVFDSGGTVTSEWSLSEAKSKFIKECIPCLERIDWSFQIHPGRQLEKILEAELMKRLNALLDLGKLLQNADFWNDTCRTLDFLNFMCVPDLQRILSLLAASLLDINIQLNRLFSNLMILMAPFIMPLIMGIVSLIEQYIQLVLAPINCIITSINEQIRKLDISGPNSSLKQDVTAANQKATDKKNQLAELQKTSRNALILLGTFLSTIRNKIMDKAEKYMNMVKKFCKQWGVGTSTYTNNADQKLITLRLITLIKAIINAKGDFGKLCKDDGRFTPEDVDNFFGAYVNPNSPWVVTLTPQGDIVVSENFPNGPADSVGTNTAPRSAKTPLLDLNPISKQPVKCRSVTNVSDASKAAQWIEELNKF